jgi:hypothetical protein
VIPAWLLTAAAAAIAAGSFAGGWQVNGWRHAANERDRMAAEVQAQADQLKRMDKAAVGYIEKKAEAVARHEVIEREVIRYVQNPANSAVCLDPDGLLILQDAAAAEQARRQPATAVRGANGAD